MLSYNSACFSWDWDGVGEVFTQLRQESVQMFYILVVLSLPEASSCTHCPAPFVKKFLLFLEVWLTSHLHFLGSGWCERVCRAAQILVRGEVHQDYCPCYCRAVQIYIPSQFQRAGRILKPHFQQPHTGESSWARLGEGSVLRYHWIDAEALHSWF